MSSTGEQIRLARLFDGADKVVIVARPWFVFRTIVWLG